MNASAIDEPVAIRRAGSADALAISALTRAAYAALGYALEREEPLNGGVAVHMTKAVS